MIKYSKDEVQEFRKTINVDFDGVLHGMHNGYKIINGKPISNSKLALQELQKAGYRVVVLTARPVEDHANVRKWMNKAFGKTIVDSIEITNVKRPAMCLIDDRVIRFQGNWPDILNYLR